MKGLLVFLRTLREQARDIWSLLLATTAAPAFVLIYWSITGGGSTTYPILLLDQDQPAQRASGETVDLGQRLAQEASLLTYSDGQPMITMVPVESRDGAEAALMEREALALVALPPQASSEVAEGRPPTVTLVGDLSHPMYGVAAMMAGVAVENAVQAVTGLPPLYRVHEEAMGGSGDRTEFEGYVPGLLIISIVMCVFTASAAVAREIEAGTLLRLRLMPLSATAYLLGTSLTQVLLMVSSLLMTLGLAVLLGFRSVGPMWVALGVGVATSVSIMGVGLVVASLSRTVVRAFLVANVPLLFMMFFSGAVYPVRKVPLLHVGDKVVGLWDFLPPTHAVVALNKVLSLGCGLGEVAWELGWLCALAALYFGLGVALFRYRHLR